DVRFNQYVAGQDWGRRFALGCRPFFTEKEPPALSPGAANPDGLGKTEEPSVLFKRCALTTRTIDPTVYCRGH
ncbi:MAG: hypothetical protein ABS897_05765, partial [Eubacteriales bacterium]